MKKPRKKSVEIRAFILENVDDHPNDLSIFAANHFGISRPAVLRHINCLIEEGFIKAEGTTRGRRYELKPLVEDSFSFRLSQETEEDKVWRHLVRPSLHELTQNVLRICEYGVNEMINNAIDHSEGSRVTVQIEQSAVNIEFQIHDDGIGIFTKIQRDLHLDEPKQAILELSKGKLTTDPRNHTGEGIFFVSRMFDRFVVFSESLFYAPGEFGYDDLHFLNISSSGTGVWMSISTSSSRTVHQVFDRYASEVDDDFRFSKTDIPVSLASFGGDNLVSRSQARRLLHRLHEFQNIALDFKGVESVGQAFADEVFRVYARNNPDIELEAINVNPDIEKMIHRAKTNR
jgi:anti-sigma regulatory factor (Ser/Thr protein kinase)